MFKFWPFSLVRLRWMVLKLKEPNFSDWKKIWCASGTRFPKISRKPWGGGSYAPLSLRRVTMKNSHFRDTRHTISTTWVSDSVCASSQLSFRNKLAAERCDLSIKMEIEHTYFALMWQHDGEPWPVVTCACRKTICLLGAPVPRFPTGQRPRIQSIPIVKNPPPLLPKPRGKPWTYREW